MNAKQFQQRLPLTAFAFRGYNTTNLGRSRELMVHPSYGAVVREYLSRASQVCREVTGRRTNLESRVLRGRETSLRSYPDALSLVVSMSMAQLRCMEEFHGVHYAAAKLAYGYSLGEISALVAGGVLGMEEALSIPLTLSADCVALAHGVTLAVLFSREREFAPHEVRRLCLEINSEGNGVIDISAYLSPNSLLLMGQGDTLDRFKARMGDALSTRAHLRKSAEQWPPIHTCLVWQRCVSNRCGTLLHTMKGDFSAPRPPVFSLVTGSVSYDDFNARDLLCRWTDQPQRLWDAIYETLASGVTTVVHVGPQPNIIPATFKRVTENVEAQIAASLSMRALSGMVTRPWMKSFLPARSALLRAPYVQHINLEDWLLEQPL